MLRHYSQLWNRFGTAEFERTEAIKTIPSGQKLVGIVLSKLRKAGWLTTRIDETDARKRWYQLKDPATVIKEVGERR